MRTTDPMGFNPDPSWGSEPHIAPPPPPVKPRCPSPRCKDEDTMDPVPGKQAWRCWRCSAVVPAAQGPQVDPSVSGSRPAACTCGVVAWKMGQSKDRVAMTGLTPGRLGWDHFFDGRPCHNHDANRP